LNGHYFDETLVKVKEHPEYGRILAATKLVAAHAHPWNGTIYRSAPPKWSKGRDMLIGVGSMKSGARFNAPDSFPAVYGSTTPELAMIESLAYQRRAGLPVERALPLVFKAISVDVETLLDLTNATVLAELGVTIDQLRTEAWWLARARGEESLTQAIGRAARACGVQALLAASAHTPAHGHNIIVLPDRIRPPSQLKVLRRPAK
jgi:RES domain-containing protein